MATLDETTLKTMIITELDASDFQTQIDSVWSSWWILEGSKNAAELYLKRRVILLMLGAYSKQYDVSVGPDRRAMSQKFKALESLLSEVNAQLGIANPAEAGIGTLGVTHMSPGTYTCGRGTGRGRYSTKRGRQ